MLHPYLERQLRRLNLEPRTPPREEGWTELLEWISRGYAARDRERDSVAESLHLASQEMQSLNARLAQESAKIAGLLRVAPVGLATADREGCVLDINQELEEIIGFSPSETVGRFLWDFVPAEDVESLREVFRDLVTGKLPRNRTQRRLTVKDGRTVLAEVALRAVPDCTGQTQLVVAGVEDVTGRRELEIELRHGQKMESVGRLAAGIAHEINTPIQFVGDNINFLSGAFQQLLELCASYRSACAKAAHAPLSAGDIARLKQDEELADFEYIQANVSTSIASTLDGIGRVASIVQSVKAFAHPDGNERANADLNAALRDTLTVAANQLKYVATVETDFGPIPSIPCFVSDLNQVFLNLLVNAAHAIADVVGKTGDRGVIRVRTYQEGSIVVIAISDTGTGIPTAVQGRIFDPFFTTKDVGRGSGEGLAMARSIVVDHHNGSLTFDTELGKGTTFFVRIPFDFS